ncbi:A/G-specific adenine glycosylase [Candidatus Saccharibacteria bacterium]|nr:A/G-specific adenine glycosylase [Candidatus Saccharibacteria bacterium]
MGQNEQVLREFIDTVVKYYRAHGRHDLAWRREEANGYLDPYKVMVSELMLQQTQVSRVVPKYEAFLRQFPTYQELAAAELGEVLRAWQGLGYNRRAKFLWEAAKAIENRADFPQSYEGLVALPGVGPNTAGAILAYAFNTPAVFIETNIRTVYIHHFFRDAESVSDSSIRDVLEQTIDRENPREFYWALMDYGSFLKTTVRNNTQSRHYTKQSAFHGSRREVRGAVLRVLAESPTSLRQLKIKIADERLPWVLEALETEQLIGKSNGYYKLGSGTM